MQFPLSPFEFISQYNYWEGQTGINVMLPSCISLAVCLLRGGIHNTLENPWRAQFLSYLENETLNWPEIRSFAFVGLQMHFSLDVNTILCWAATISMVAKTIQLSWIISRHVSMVHPSSPAYSFFEIDVEYITSAKLQGLLHCIDNIVC